MDMRLRQLSHSSNEKLDSCPRAYELYKLGSDREITDKDGTGSITFAFGHLVGTGLQEVFMGLSEQQIILNAFLTWPLDLESRDDKRSKNFYLGLAAIQRLIALRKAGFLGDYEIVYFKDSPAVELSLAVLLPDDFRYRGYVDLVLRSKSTGKVLVVDGKTTWFTNQSPAQYKNSEQALSYSVVLDAIFPDIVSYNVMYLVYKTKSYEWEPMEFTKSYLSRAEWIKSLEYRREDIIRYEAAGYFPKRGQSCTKFGRDCEYLQTCGMSTGILATPLSEEAAERITHEIDGFSVVVTLEELINAQLRKS